VEAFIRPFTTQADHVRPEWSATPVGHRQDRFAESGPYEALLEKCGLSVASIVEAAESAIAAKRG